MHKDAKICSDPISISPLHSYAFICTKYAKICKISEGMLVNVLFFFLSNLLLKIISVLLPLTNHLKWMSCFLSIEQKKCEEKIFQLHAMSTCIDEGFLSAKSGISCLALKIFNLSNPEMTILDAKNLLKGARYKELSTVFFQWMNTKS